MKVEMDQRWDSLARSVGLPHSLEESFSLFRYFYSESHGQNCASLMLSKTSEVDRILAFPWVPDPPYLTPAFFDDLSEGLKESGVKTVNLSVAFSPDILETMEGQVSGWWTRWKARRRHRQRASLIFQWFTDFIRKNPNLVFVIAAGNQGADLASLEFHTSALSEPNVLVVGAIDRNGKKADFSNWSPPVRSRRRRGGWVTSSNCTRQHRGKWHVLRSPPSLTRNHTNPKNPSPIHPNPSHRKLPKLPNSTPPRFIPYFEKG